ncbi:hypothetical protein D9757_013513 [Collybiopsis confluens]|uniref:Uncharacterized protein n=1 Tax=Collybiopsis confluens TaxID=2823264 RepID=A0A8H5FQ52_9AGAR|nr:hypothetical protein D9757_013513 [Collybiopsis confluens]
MLSCKTFSLALAAACFAFFVWSSPIQIPLSSFEAISLSQTVKTNCSSPPDPPHSCVFYAACLEPHFHCGSQGYPLGFGEKFCTKFNLPQNVGRLSDKGKEWMWDTMACLQRALVTELDIPAPSSSSEACKALETKAFSTHAPCYLSSGLCSLNPKDWAVIVDIIGIRTLFGTRDALRGAVEAGEGCLKFFAKEWDKGVEKEL